MSRRQTPPGRHASAAWLWLVVGVAEMAVAHRPAHDARPADLPDAGARTPAADVEGAASVARAFLESYLAFRHGRVSASQIAGASAALRAELAVSLICSERVARRRRARVAELRTQIQPGGLEALASARVIDGADTAIVLALRLARTGAGWQVSGVERA